MASIIPTTLAFARSIEPSIFAMWGCSSSSSDIARVPVEVVVETKRGTIANALKPDALSKFVSGGDDKKNPANANPQSVEAAYLPAGCDTLILTGQIAFIPNARKPSICNSAKFSDAYTAFDTAFGNTKNGWTELADRYVMNIINARFAWRNKITAQTISVILKDSDNNEARFDALSIAPNCLHGSKVKGSEKFIAGVAKALQAPFSSPAYVIAVTCNLQIGEGAVVYPSQEFSSSKDKDDRGQEVGKILANRKLASGVKQGILHEQKIGNAIRQIDTWYDAQLGPLQPLAAEPYAPLTNMGVFYRQGKKTSGGNKVEHFYDILDDIAQLTTATENSKNADDRALYFSSVICRGGVFGAKSE